MNPLYWIHGMLASANALERFLGVFSIVALGLLPLVGIALLRRWRAQRRRRANRRDRHSRRRTREATKEDVEASRR